MSDCVHPCPWGFFGDLVKPYTCAHEMVTKYQRISGPLFDSVIETGAIPIIAAKAGNHEGDDSINVTIPQIAYDV